METYSLLRSVPVLADLGRRLRSWYHSLKHVNRTLRLGLQLGELFLQLTLLFSWPIIILCYVPIIITDRILHGLLTVLIRRWPAIMGPPSDVYETVTGFVFSHTIGRVIVFFVLLSAYFLFFVFEFLRATLNFILFFISPLTYEEGAEVLAPSQPRALHPQPARPRLQPADAVSGTVAAALSSAHRGTARGAAGSSPRRRGGRHRGLSPRRWPWSAAGGVASASSSSKASEDGGAGGSAAALRRSVVYRLRRRHAPPPTRSPQAGAAAEAAESEPALPVWRKTVTLAEAAASANTSETCSGTDSQPESQYDVTDAQRIVVSTIPDPVPQDLEASFKSGRDESWYDALSFEHIEEVKRQGSASPECRVETETGVTNTEAAGSGKDDETLRVAVPKLEARQASASSRLEHLQIGDGGAGTVRRPSVTAARPGDTRRRPSFIPRLSAQVSSSTD